MYFIGILVLAVAARFGNARPMHISSDGPTPSFGRRGVDHYIIGGVNASPGAWPWQLSLQYLSGGTWYHICGATLLSPTKVLCASHCVDGMTPSSLRIVAGLYRQSVLTGTQAVAVSSTVMHERYELDYNLAATSNDISIIHLASSVTTNANVQFASLPPNDLDNFAGKTCTMTGWGRTSSSSDVPDILQQANIGVITTASCNTLLSPVSGAFVWDKQICLYDTANRIGSCQGDSGGPVNCPDGYGGYYVAGVTSWGVSNSNVCLQTYPSVYTRTSSYLYWIYNH